MMMVHKEKSGNVWKFQQETNTVVDCGHPALLRLRNILITDGVTTHLMHCAHYQTLTLKKMDDR